MTINLPKDLEGSIRAEVASGRFASLDAMIAEAVRVYLGRPDQGQAAEESPATEVKTVPERKPIWERVQELTADVPDEIWDQLPTDLAEQHDHYIYGTPKRRTT